MYSTFVIAPVPVGTSMQVRNAGGLSVLYDCKVYCFDFNRNCCTFVTINLGLAKAVVALEKGSRRRWHTLSLLRAREAVHCGRRVENLFERRMSCATRT